MKATKLKEAVAQGLGIKWYDCRGQIGGQYKSYCYIILWGKYQGIWEYAKDRGYQRREIGPEWYRGMSCVQDGKYLHKTIKGQAAYYVKGGQVGRGVMVKLLREVHKNVPAWALKTLRAKHPGVRKVIPLLSPEYTQALGQLELKFIKEKHLKVHAICSLAEKYNMLHRVKYMTEQPTKATFKKIFRTFTAQSINALWAQWCSERTGFNAYWEQTIHKIERGTNGSTAKLTKREKLVLSFIKNVAEAERSEKYTQVKMLVNDSLGVIAWIHSWAETPLNQERTKQLYKITRIKDLHEFHDALEMDRQRAQAEFRLKADKRYAALMAVKEYKPFPHPLPAGVTQLLTPEAMDAEGNTMKHCIAGYKLDAAESKSYFFKYDYDGIRGSIQVTTSWLQEASWRVVQFFGKRNSVIPKEHHQRITSWLLEAHNVQPALEQTSTEGINPPRANEY